MGFTLLTRSSCREAQHLLPAKKRVPRNIKPLSSLISDYIRLKEAEQACHELTLKHPPLGEILNIIQHNAQQEKRSKGATRTVFGPGQAEESRPSRAYLAAFLLTFHVLMLMLMLDALVAVDKGDIT